MISKKHYGSDHYVHLMYINKFKKEQKKFGEVITSYYNQENAVYPLLFHWLIANFFYKSAILYPNRINQLISFIGQIFLNVFIYFYIIDVSFLDLLVINILVLIFPFSYSFWNAKNRGISARGIGLILGQLFTYTLIFYLDSPSIICFLGLLVISFITLLTSQFSSQYIFFLIVFLSIYTTSLELLTLPLVSSIIYYFFFPSLAKSFFKGQYYHKYNYANYLAPIFILKARPSIYRDFFYDFWIKLKNIRKDKINILKYIFTNPLLELIYGFPFLWVLLWVAITKESFFFNGLLWRFIFTGILLFILTSFRKTRFLGEPQRYMEFLIPIIAIVFYQSVNDIVLYWTCLLVFIFLLITQAVIFFIRNKVVNPFLFVEDMIYNNLDSNDVIISNDTNLIKSLLPKHKVLSVDLTRRYNSKEDFLLYTPKNYSIISIDGLVKFKNDYKANILLLNLKLYNEKDIHELHEKLSLKVLVSKECYVVYSIIA